jgi:FkbM family methyltransferase
MIQKIIKFNNKEYVYNHSSKDNSGIGCIMEIIDKGEYELQRFNDLDGKVIIDIGGNHGLATIILAKQNPKSKVYVFEPNPNVFHFLEKNVKDNHLNNVIMFNKAIHTKKGLKLVEHPECSGASILTNEKQSMDVYFKENNLYNRLDVNEIDVETISLDEFLTEHKIDEIF